MRRYSALSLLGDGNIISKSEKEMKIPDPGFNFFSKLAYSVQYNKS